MLTEASFYILPSVIAFTVGFAVFRKVAVLDAFVEGAENGIKTLYSILPTLIGITVAINMLRSSGFIGFLTSALSPVLERVGIKAELLPLALLSPLSGSGSLSVYGEVLSEYGADSTVGRIASVMTGSTETTFFAVSVYFGSVGIKNTGCTLYAGLFADFTAFVLSGLFVKMLM
ncbi:MAG: nucleoside recognition domain-containing protein [Acutalibacteraceae bacterium]|nr:nucleoside recognition domain-containing protein [Oscillospiraceae bacterium]